MFTHWDTKLASINEALIITLQISLTAKVHVWYGVAPLALIVLEERVRMTPVWLWLALTAPLTYLFYAVDPPSEPTWVLLLEWGGAVVMMLAAIPLLRHRSRDLPEDDSCEKV